MDTKVTCPYCQQRYWAITAAHLKKHNKSRLDLTQDFPDLSYLVATEKILPPSGLNQADAYFIEKHVDQQNFKNGRYSKWQSKAPKGGGIHRLQNYS